MAKKQKGKNLGKAAMNFRRRALFYCKQKGLIVSGDRIKNADLLQLIIVNENTIDKSKINEMLLTIPAYPNRKNPKKAKDVMGVMPVRTRQLFRVPDHEFFSSREWLTLRYAALREHGFACQCCGATRDDGVKLHVDHVLPRSKFPKLQWELSNLQVLCDACNLGKGAWDDTDFRPKRVF